MAYENNCPLKEGFLATPNINAPKTTPIPIPAPIKPVVASPVPMILAACITFLLNCYKSKFRKVPLYFENTRNYH